MSMTMIHQAIPENAPQPMSWGVYSSDPDTYFYCSSFHTVTDGIPDAHDFPEVVARLHKNGTSPSGKFGFPVPSYAGRMPRNTGSCDTWEESFSTMISHFFGLEEAAQGYDEDMSNLREAIMSKVIPRLLRPLENGGRTMVPGLVHGDLWDGNCSVDATTGCPIMFDSSCSYAHHEYELAPWRPPRHKIGKPYVTEYLRHFTMSEPAEDFDGRNALYCVSVATSLQLGKTLNINSFL